MHRIVLFLGPKGAGKTSLLRALFPGTSFRDEEPGYYHTYDIGDLRVRELTSNEDHLGILVNHPWLPSTDSSVLVVAPGSMEVPEIMLRISSMASRRAVVLNKAEEAGSSDRLFSEKLASRLGADLFTTSAKEGTGVSRLRSWIGVRPAAPGKAGALLIPVPTSQVPVGLSEEEERVLRLCDGSRTVEEIAALLGMSVFRVKVVLKRLETRGAVRIRMVLK